MKILGYLAPFDLCRAAQTCRFWRSLCDDNQLWRRKCFEDAILPRFVLRNDLFTPTKKQTIAAPARWPWKTIFQRQCHIERNWCKLAQQPHVLRGHDDHVITCLEFDGKRIVSGSDDGSLRVWSAVTLKVFSVHHCFCSFAKVELCSVSKSAVMLSCINKSNVLRPRHSNLLSFLR